MATSLLSYMCELNPLEFTWADVKSSVKEYNVMGKLSLMTIQEVTENVMKSITWCEWEGYINHIKKTREVIVEKNGLMEEVINNFVISIGGIESSDEDSNKRSEPLPDWEIVCKAEQMVVG